jgi:hypothetical protein
LGLGVFLGAVSELWQFSISQPLSPHRRVPFTGRFADASRWAADIAKK